MDMHQVAARELFFRYNENRDPKHHLRFRTFAEARAFALYFRYNENHDPDNGQFTSGGGGSGGTVEPTETKLDHAPALNAKAINVGGDEWNRETATRLETEYQRVRPDIEKIATDAVIKNDPFKVYDFDDPKFEDEDKPFVPDEWDVMSGDQQEEAKSHYVENNKSDYIDNEVNYWHESGQALDDAKSSVVYNFNDGSGDDWAHDALDNYLEAREERNKPVPYTSDQLIDAIKLEYQDGHEGHGDLTVEFDDDKLSHPSTLVVGQLDLPGIEPLPAHAALTEEMRTEIEEVMSGAFDKEADDKESDMEAPDYIGDDAAEQLEEQWNSMDDSDKFSWTEHNTDIIKEAENEAESYGKIDKDSGSVAMPGTFDPLQQNGGNDYQRTQRLANYVSLERQSQLMTERNIDYTKHDLKQIDDQLWSGWKGSSTNFAGSILQLAASKELGGRYRELQTHSVDLIKQADEKYKRIGGFAGIKALVRAKWETTQYLLDKANLHTVEVYRGLKVDLSDADKAKIETIVPDISGTEFEKIPDASIVRNGAMSTTTDRGVANGWGAGSGDDKIVLRIDAPRTSVLSVPAYGINVHSEREVVIAGTAWNAWDAWRGYAPSFDQVPMKAVA